MFDEHAVKIASKISGLKSFKVSFGDVKDVTLGEVFGSGEIRITTAVRKLFDFIKQRKLMRKACSCTVYKMIKKSFVPSRAGVSEKEVFDNVRAFGNESDLDLIQASRRNPGRPYVVGGDSRIGEPPYIFSFEEVTGRFSDNVVQ